MNDNSKKEEASARRKKLGQYLLEDGLIEENELAAALKDQENRPEKIGRMLIEKKLVSDIQLARMLARQHNLPFARLENMKIPSEVINIAPAKLVRLHGLIPVKMLPNGLIVATAYPDRFYDMEKDIKFVVQMRIEAVVVPEKDIQWALDTYYPQRTPLTEGEIEDVALKDIEVVKPEDETDGTTIEDIEKIAGLPPVVRFTNRIFAEGILMGASDLHLEPQKDYTVVRFRIDGLMRSVMRTKKKNHLPVVSRIKIMSGLDISIRRLPQDGKAQILYGGTVYDLRVSTLPTYYGEKVTIRILDPAVTRVAPENLGLVPENLSQLLEAIRRPDGLIVVTGPTGSGKTSTLYACLNKLNTPEVNIITVEDPVEFDVEGINQVQINSKAGMTFAASLRSILRQDPDIVMVGEIRDAETAAVSMQAAQTGHMVLSTLHTNDAPSALSRLMDLKVEPFLVSSSLIVAIGQRLVRKICPKCKVRKPLSPEVKKSIASYLDNSNTLFWVGTGCEECNQTGYKGRMGIFELLVMGPSLKKAISGDFDLAEFKNVARRTGFRTMFEDGLTKAFQGLTTVDEVLRTAAPQEGESGDHTSISTGQSEVDLNLRQPRSGAVEITTNWQPDETPAFTEEEPPALVPEKNTVLVVEDNTDILVVLKRTLEKENINVLVAENGKIGLEMAIENRPVLIITDYRMPVMDGFAFIKELKKNKKLSSIPIIMLTAKGEVETEVAVLEAGVDDYVVKPVDRRRFLARVRRLLKKTSV